MNAWFRIPERIKSTIRIGISVIDHDAHNFTLLLFLPSQSGFSKMEYIFHLKCKTDYICLPYNLSVSNRRFHKIRNGPKICLEFLFSSWGLGSVSHLVRLWQYFWFDCLIDDWIWCGLAQITFSVIGIKGGYRTILGFVQKLATRRFFWTGDFAKYHV